MGEIELNFLIPYNMTYLMPLLPIFQTGVSFQANSLAWPRLPRTTTEPRRVIGSYSGVC